ncbi:MAG: hypothetical protein KGZ39_05240 [Simkania sp.]|nr:hypothetical protein [Simkania sp.]
MKSLIKLSSLVILGFFLLVTAHLTFLYLHRESKMTVQDFYHPFISTLDGLTDENARNQAIHIVQQPFSYLGAGQQMIAFESHDQRYVIKFFRPIRRIREERFHQFKTLREFFTSRWIFPIYFQKKRQLLKLFQCYQVAFDVLREESGLLYVHLHRTSALPHSLCLTDKDGIAHTIDLTLAPFVLQEKAELASASLHSAIQAGEQKKAQEMVKKLQQLFISRTTKGFTDNAQTLHNNYGFLRDKAIQIDLGKLYFDKHLLCDPHAEIQKLLLNLENSLQHISPSLCEHLLKKTDP